MGSRNFDLPRPHVDLPVAAVGRKEDHHPLVGMPRRWAQHNALAVAVNNDLSAHRDVVRGGDELAPPEAARQGLPHAFVLGPRLPLPLRGPRLALIPQALLALLVLGLLMAFCLRRHPRSALAMLLGASLPIFILALAAPLRGATLARLPRLLRCCRTSFLRLLVPPSLLAALVVGAPNPTRDPAPSIKLPLRPPQQAPLRDAAVDRLLLLLYIVSEMFCQRGADHRVECGPSHEERRRAYRHYEAPRADALAPPNRGVGQRTTWRRIGHRGEA
mmetsp:Transcript_17999/g.38415  ORF Transcript_17999/g.38415 Transcript_17999/m.38415 type:complete len:274 (-) Transcript_17999:8-829(-)